MFFSKPTFFDCLIKNVVMTDYEDNFVNFHIRSLGNSINHYSHDIYIHKSHECFCDETPMEDRLSKYQVCNFFLCLFLNAAGSVPESCNELHVYDQPSISDLVAYI